MEAMLNNNINPNNNHVAGQGDDQVVLGAPVAEHCPRCNSRNTKFCYYNNYSLNQPRHYCKTCRRYWTQGGICRNVPVGGASRRNRRARVGAAGDPLSALVPRVPRRRGRGANAAAAAIAAVAGRSMAVAGRNVAVQAGRGRGRIISSTGTNFPSQGTNFPSLSNNYPNPFQARFSAFRRTMASLCPLPLLATSASVAMTASNLSLLQEFTVNHNLMNNNNAFVGFGSFPQMPPMPPLSGGSAWQQESLMMRSTPNENMFLWGFNGASGRHSFGGGSGGGAPVMNDIDFMNTQWNDLPDFGQPPPPPFA